MLASRMYYISIGRYRTKTNCSCSVQKEPMRLSN